MEAFAEKKVRVALENTFDLPFLVQRKIESGDILYGVSPKSEEENLFHISIRIREQLRIVIGVTPERYAAFSINDMAEASNEKKSLFAGFANQLYARKATVEFFINQTRYQPEAPETWPSHWKNYSFRASRCPITNEDEVFNEIETVCSWLIIVTGMFLSLLNVITTQSEGQKEGGVKVVTQKRYERNPINRELCLAENGYICRICGMNFEEKYGEIGRRFIHVHHIVPISKMTESYIINPVTDLIPVCPNCHAMLHRTDPPLLPEDLKTIINTLHSEDD